MVHFGCYYSEYVHFCYYSEYVHFRKITIGYQLVFDFTIQKWSTLDISIQKWSIAEVSIQKWSTFDVSIQNTSFRLSVAPGAIYEQAIA